MTPWYRWEADDLVLSLRVQPRARKDEFLEPEGDAFKIRINAAPEKGKANDHLKVFLAKSFGVARNRVVFESGSRSRKKRIRITNPKKFPIPAVKRT